MSNRIPPASNFSSPASSETSESNTLQKIHSFSSITQLYFKFNKQPNISNTTTTTTNPNHHQSRLSSVNSLSSSYSNQSNLNRQPLLPPPPPPTTTKRTLHHQSSLPRFTQTKLKLRPRLNSTATTTNINPLAISRRTILPPLPTPTPTPTPPLPPPPPLSLAIFPNSNRTSLPSSPTSSTSHTSSSTSSLPLSTTPSSIHHSSPISSTLHLQSTPSTQPIHVIVRLRDQTKPNPPQLSELVSFDNESITLRIPVSMTNTNQQVNSYEFKVDRVIYPTPNAKLNVKVYERCSIETKLLIPFLNGFNSSLIAYGQTGSGKSFTLGSDNDPHNTDGLIPKTLERLFVKLDNHQHEDHSELMVSFIEIYNDEIIDLLLNPPQSSNDHSSPLASNTTTSHTTTTTNHTTTTKLNKKLPIKIIEDKSDGSIDLVGCKKLKINDLNQAMTLFNHGLNQRSIGFTQMNQASSRSHAIFTLHLISSSTSSSSTSNSNLSNNSHLIVKRTCSKFQFVDLAGSERINKTKNILGGDRFKEGIFINAGLHSLGNVISALSNQPSSMEGMSNNNSGNKKKKNHIPYRESKLTRLLKDCLGGNSKTILISCISQNAQDLNESLNTLRYAIRAKKIENVSQKTTKVISTPTVIPIKTEKAIGSVRAAGPVNRIQTPLARRLQNASSSGSTRTVPSRAGTVVMSSGSRREIKKPMVMMKHELSKIKALKSMVSKAVVHPSASSLHQDHDPLQPAVYLAEQVHKFFAINNLNHVRLNGPLTPSSRPIQIDAHLVQILRSHFDLSIPSSSTLALRPHTNSLIHPPSSFSSSTTHSIISGYSNTRMIKPAFSASSSDPSNTLSLTTTNNTNNHYPHPATFSNKLGIELDRSTSSSDEPFLHFLFDLNSFLCSTTPTSTALPLPSPPPPSPPLPPVSQQPSSSFDDPSSFPYILNPSFSNLHPSTHPNNRATTHLSNSIINNSTTYNVRSVRPSLIPPFKSSKSPRLTLF